MAAVRGWLRSIGQPDLRRHPLGMCAVICPHCHLENRGGFHSADYCIERLGEIIARLPITGMILPREPVDHDAYRRGQCCDCATAQRSPGRPRCIACHEAHVARRPVFAPQLQPGQLAPCALAGCSKPTMPGRVRCGPCDRARKADQKTRHANKNREIR